MKKGDRYFLRFVILYLCVLLPTLCASLFSNRLIADELSANALRQAQESVQSILDDLSDLYSRYQAAGNFLTNYYQLSERVMNRGSQQATEGITFLNFANQFDSLTTDIFMNYGTQEAYSGKGLSRLNTLFGVTLQCTPESVLVAQETVAATENANCCLWSSPDSGYLLMHFVTNAHDRQRVESVNYVIPLNNLLAPLELLENEQSGSITIHFQRGGDVTLSRSWDEQQFRLQSSAQADTVRPDGIAFETGSELLNVRISAVFEPSRLYERVVRSQTTDLLILALGLLLSMGLSCFFGLDRSRRVRQLEAFAKGESTAMTTEWKDEFSSLQQIMHHSFEKMEQVYSDQKVYRDGYCRQMARLLFNGIYKSRSVFEASLSLCGVEIVELHYILVGVRLPREDGGALETKLAGQLSNELYYTAYILDMPVLVFLHEMPNTDEDQSIRTAYASQLHSEVKDPTLQIGFSRVYDDVMKAHEAFRDIERIYEQYPVAKPFVCREILPEATDFAVRFSEEELQALSDAIERKDKDAAVEMVQAMCAQLRQDRCTENNRAYLRYSITQAILRSVQEAPNGQELLTEIVRVNMETAAGFEPAAVRLTARCCNGNVSVSDFERLLAFIQEHYSEPSFSAEMAASFAGISTSYLSRLFKAKMNMTYIDYLTSLRMQRARELMRETKLPLKEIVEMVGYIDVSGFRRKFKSLYGIGVSEFRNATGKEE